MFKKLYQCPVSITIFTVFTIVTSTLYAQLNIICPDEAPVGSPVLIQYEGIPEDASKLVKINKRVNDTFLELFDANGKAVTIFWSLDPGPRTIQLITCSHPEIQETSHTLNYGNNPGPGPEPNPDSRVATLVAYVSANDMSKSDLVKLSEFYSDFADELLKSNLTDTGQFRQAYIEAGRKFFEKTNIKGKYSGLAGILDSILANSLSLEIVSLDRIETADLLKSISLAFSKGGD